ncbi:MAG: DUF6597 domain-containing transcriptional factor [Coprobacillaceae bacterium]
MITKTDILIFEDKHRILLQADEFICLLPDKELQEYISNYNITFPNKELMSNTFTVMPCGCSTLSIKKDDKRLFIELHGPVTKPYIVGSKSNQLEIMVTIEFRPAGLYAFTGINQSELIDEIFPFETVNYNLNEILSSLVKDAKSVNEILSNLDETLLKHMNITYHPELQHILQIIKNAQAMSL